MSSGKRFFSWKPGIFFLSLLVMVSAGSLFGKDFRLMVEDVSGLKSPWPMVGSLAFPKGDLKDVSSVRIMSKGQEIPCQVDVAATWRDGSVRWALAGFTAPPVGEYRVEYGQANRKAGFANPLRVIRGKDGDFTIDTGAAVFMFEKDNLLPSEAWLVFGENKRQVLGHSGAGAYLVDNLGRTARVAGLAAGVENTFVKEGPGRAVLKRSGWYVTQAGDRLGRADVWFYFAAGSPVVRVTHTLIFTEDTNKVWFKDYGLEFKTLDSPDDVYCTAGEPGLEEIIKVAGEGKEVYLMQDNYPHFAERKYRAVIGKGDAVIEEFNVAGDWAHGNYGNFGITLAMPWLAERFPKEISFGPGGARAVLWSGRSGRELDFRVKTLVREYFERWVTEGLGMTTDKELENAKSNAQGTSRTHDVWLILHNGPYVQEDVRRNATAGSRNPLVMAEPSWLCSTGANGNQPMRHKDTAGFPAEEALISDYWDRLILPLRAFPMTGYIAWGCYPDRSYVEVKGKLMSSHHALSNLREYGVRREPWRLYARSGERRYYDWGHRFSRFTGDWCVVNWESPGKPKGAFITASGGSGRSGKLPLFWGEKANPMMINSGVIGHWLLDYYLTGDERSLDIMYRIKESFAANKWDVRGNILGLKPLISLSMLDWDENALRAARETAHTYIDLESQNGIKGGGYGPMYKDHRTGYTLAEYYLETGDETIKEAILKLHDQRYRFDRRYRPGGHKNHDLFMHSLAYWITGEKKHRYVVEQILQDALYYSGVYPLSEDLKKKPDNPLEWPNLFMPPIFPGPRRAIQLGQHEFHNPFIGIPAALKLLAEEGRTGKRVPVAVKSMDMNMAYALVKHESPKETVISLYYSTLRKDVRPEVLRYPLKEGEEPLKGIKVDIEKRIQWPQNVLLRPDDIFHAFITIPGNISPGLYLVSLGGNEPFTLLDTSNDCGALYCPEGFWSANGSPIRRRGEGAFGRAGEGVPMYFRVPDGLGTLRLFLGRAARIRRPDGSIALEWSDETIGNVEIPCEGQGGIWRLDPYIHGFSGFCPPSFYRLLNVEPVVAFGSPSFLPEGMSGGAKIVTGQLPEPRASLEFVQGVLGKAVRLSSGRTLSFGRGSPVSKGGHSFFPWEKGTVEFWFMPARSTHEVPIKMTQAILQSFLKASQVHLCHIHEVRSSQMDIDSNLRLDLVSAPLKPSPAGYQSQHFFMAGRWVHVAFTWDLRPSGDSMEGELAIFVDGKRMPFKSGSFQIPAVIGKSKPFSLWDKTEDIVLGPFDGAMDVLRISDTVRYTGDFLPSKKGISPDSGTRGFFMFDGDLEGRSFFSSDPVILK